VKTGDLNFMVDFGMKGFVCFKIFVSERYRILSVLYVLAVFADFELLEKIIFFSSSWKECSPVVSI